MSNDTNEYGEGLKFKLNTRNAYTTDDGTLVFEDEII